MGLTTKEKTTQIFLNRPRSRLDVTQDVSSRRPWGSEVTALRSTTHIMDKKGAAESAKAGATSWSKRQRMKTEDFKFWKTEDWRTLRANHLAASGAPPAHHPDSTKSHIGGHTEISKLQPARTKMQKRSDKAMAVRTTKIAGCAKFSSDEPLIHLVQNDSLDYVKIPSDLVTISKSSKLSSRPHTATNRKRQQSQRPSSSTAHRREDVTRGVPLCAPLMMSSYDMMTMSCTAHAQHQPPLLNPKVNPPKSVDAHADRARNIKLQQAKRSAMVAERLLSLSAGSVEIAQCMKLAQQGLQEVANAPAQEYDPDAPFVRSMSCSRFT